MVGQPLQQAVHGLGLLLEHAMGPLADGGQLGGRRHAGRIAAADPGRPGPHQAGHAHQEELIQVGTDDGQEFQSFQQRQVLGQPLAA